MDWGVQRGENAARIQNRHGKLKTHKARFEFRKKIQNLKMVAAGGIILCAALHAQISRRALMFHRSNPHHTWPDKTLIYPTTI